MTDNVEVTAGNGTPLATDDVNGIHHARCKLSLGADGSATDAVGGSGVVGADTQRMTLATNDPAVQSLATMDDVVHAEDAAHATGHKGIPAWAVRRDAKSVGSGTDGDYSPLNVNENGDLRVDNGVPHTIAASPTVSTSAYTAGDVFGTKMTLTNAARVSGGAGVLKAITMFDSGANALVDTIDVLLFDEDPSATTFTDNDALALVAGDGAKLIAAIPLNTIVATGTNGRLLQARGLDIPYLCVGAANLYAVAVHRGTWQPAATSGVTFKFHMVRQ